jgi:hypothetical protein
MSFSIRELSVNIDGALHGRPEPGVQSCDTTEPSDAAKPSCDDRSTRRPPPGKPGQPRPPKHKPRDVPPPERDSGCDMNSNQETSDQADGWNAADLADLRAQLDATLGDDPAR